MAEINTKINLIDNMSPALKGMHKALNVLLNTFEAVAAKTKTPIDVKAVQTARNELARVGVMLDKVGTEAGEASAKVKQVAAATSNLTSEQEKAILRQDRLTRSANDTVRSEERLKKATSDAFAAEQRAITASERMKQSITQTSIKQQQLSQAIRRSWIYQEKFKQSVEKTAQVQTQTKIKQEQLTQAVNRTWQAQERTKQATERTTVAIERAKQAVIQTAIKCADWVKKQELVKAATERTKQATERTKQAIFQTAIKSQAWAKSQELVKQAIERTKQATERTFQAVERTKQAVERTLQAQEKTRQVFSKTKVVAEQIKQAVEKTKQAVERTKKSVIDTAIKFQQWLQSIEKSKQAQEKTKQSVEKTAQAVLKTKNLQELLNNSILRGVQIEKRTKLAEEQTNNAKKRGLLTDKQIEMANLRILQLKNRIAAATEKNIAAQNRLNQSTAKSSAGQSMLWSKMKSLAGAYIGVQTVGGVIKTADSLAANEARLNLMVKEGETVKGLSDKIYAAAMRSRTGYLAMADSVAKLGIQAGHLFGNNDQMVRFMETFNKIAVISKSTTQQTNAAMTQLIQALSFGQLRGDELKSILENMPFVAHLIADELERVGYAASDLPKKLRHIAEDGKVTEDEIRAIGYEGELASETVVNAMLNGAKKVDKMAKNMTWTWAQVWEVFKNAALRAFTPIFEGISKIIQTDRFKRFATWVDGAMTRVANAMVGLWNTAGPIIAKIFDGVAAIGNFIGRNWSFIAPIIWGIVWAMTALKIITMAQAIWTGILTAAKVVGAFVTWAFTKATVAQAGAQWGLNAAMYACPLTWIIIAIIAVIVVIYLAVAAINHFAGTSYSATGFIAGVFMALFALIYNNVAIIWNAFASFAEFLVNVFKHPAYATKKLFVDLAVNIIDCLIAMTKGCDDFATSFVNAMYSAINFVLDGWNWMVDKLGIVGEKMGLGKAAKLEASTSITSDLTNAKAAIESSVADMPADYWEAPKMEHKDIGGYYMKGYNWGNDVSKKFEGFTKGKSLEDVINGSDLSKNVEGGDFSKALNGGFDDPATGNGASGAGQNPALDKIAGDTGKIADATGKTADNTSNDDEYFKYLRRAGERESMNRQQLVNFKVDMSNVNHIKSGIDVNEVMKRLAKELYNEVVGKMEGPIAY